GLRQDHLTAALQTLLDHHDALRLRVIDPVAMRLEVAAAGSIRAADCVHRIEIEDVGAAGLATCVREAGQGAAARLLPARGVMVQAVWLDAGADAPGRLVVAIHHLAVDGVSWRILIPDLAAAYETIANGGTPQPAPRGTSLRHWA